MGASVVMTHVILFIAVLSITSGLLLVIKNYADETEGTFNQKADEYQNIIRTNIKIEVIHYNNETNTTWLYIRNIGQTTLDPDAIDVYIDGVRFPRDIGNRTIEVSADTEQRNIGLWDPKEQVLIKAARTLNDTMSHEAIITTPYGVRDTETFSI